MKTSTPCPGCQKPITIEVFEDFSSPFTSVLKNYLLTWIN